MARIVEYRRANRSKTWHCCRNCPHWPRNSFNIVRVEQFPADFQLCDECDDLQRTGRCSGANPPPD